MMLTISQILATGLTGWLFWIFYKWCKKDEQEKKQAELEERKIEWQKSIEEAGRRLLEQDARMKLLKENGEENKGRSTEIKGDFHSIKIENGIVSAKDESTGMNCVIGRCC